MTKGSILSILDNIDNILETKELNTDLAFVDIVDHYLVVANQDKISLLDIENDFSLVKEMMLDIEDDMHISTIIIIN